MSPRIRISTSRAVAAALALAALGGCASPGPRTSGIDTLADLRLPADPPSSRVQPSASTAQTPHSGVVSIPIQVIDNIVLVPLTLNRSQGATFLLDTGAQFTVLTPALAARIGLDVSADAPTRTLLVVGGQKITIPFVRLPVIELGSGRLEDVEVGIHAVAPEMPLIDGLLGGDILGRFTMTVDRVARQLRLEPTGR
jgi:predicted aspartyl protease